MWVRAEAGLQKLHVGGRGAADGTGLDSHGPDSEASRPLAACPWTRWSVCFSFRACSPRARAPALRDGGEDGLRGSHLAC